MTDRERVLALVEEGKITRQEADRLLAALGDVEEVETAVSKLEREVENRQPKQEPSKPEKEAAKKPITLPEDLHWVRVNLLAGDIDIKVDASLSEPEVKGKVEVVKEGDNFVIKARSKATGDSIGDMISGFVDRFGDLDIRVPPGYGVEVGSKAGDVDISDVPFLKGHLLAGDIDAKNIGGVDLSLSAGDIDISLRPTSGQHRISATAGDVDVKLLEGSSVKVEGSVSMGDFHAEGFSVDMKKSMMGGGFSGCLGEGAATLSIELSAGDLDVVAHE